jgi:hypothetical protein
MKPHFARGSKNDVAFVFSCPGRHEQEAKHPAAGVTGRNLERLLPLLALHINMSSLVRAEITVTNAWDKVEYRKMRRRWGPKVPTAATAAPK